MAKRDYYEVLMVARDASDRDIAKSYRKLAVKYHPDSNPGDDDASVKFKECAEAYEVLGDSNKRAKYDRFGHAGVDGGSQFGNAEDIFAAFGEMFGGGGGGGMFGDIFGRGGGGGRRQRAGADVQVEVTLTLEEAASGVTRQLQFNRRHRCGKCEGSGSNPGSRPEHCQQCGGRGQILKSAGILQVQTTCPVCRGAGQIIVDPCDECRGAGQVKTVLSQLDCAIPCRRRRRHAGSTWPAKGNRVPTADRAGTVIATSTFAATSCSNEMART